MPGLPSLHRWATFPAAAYRSLLFDSFSQVQKAFLSGPRATRFSRNPKGPKSTQFGRNPKGGPQARRQKTPNSGQSGRQGEHERGKWRSRPAALSERGFRKPSPSSANGLKVKRKRKRIKPFPGDVTFKRGVESKNINSAAVNIGQNPKPTEEKEKEKEKAEPSLNSQFRQIQPSRALLTFVEENLLGRRRLAEWRSGGYDPRRTAPLDDLPGGKTKRNPIQESVFKHQLKFIAAAKQVPSLPPPELPEVAFAGRSNVGKSSLINALTRRWGVARTSEKPGLTQSINFFTLGSQLCLVDLPGYGFAYAKEGKKEEWEELVKYYVQSRANLKRVCLLVDAKWGLKPRDEELLHLMESAGRRFQVVLTKTDILPPVDLARRVTQIRQVLETHRCLVEPLMMVSSKTGAGLQRFRASLALLVGPNRIMEQEDF